MERLAELRERRALTLRELSAMSGVAADTINQIELGHRKPRPSTLRKLANALGVKAADFFGEPEAPKVEAPESLLGHLRALSTDERREHVIGLYQMVHGTWLDEPESTIGASMRARRLAQELGLSPEELLDALLKQNEILARQMPHSKERHEQKVREFWTEEKSKEAADTA